MRLLKVEEIVLERILEKKFECFLIKVLSPLEFCSSIIRCNSPNMIFSESEDSNLFNSKYKVFHFPQSITFDECI